MREIGNLEEKCFSLDKELKEISTKVEAKEKEIINKNLEIDMWKMNVSVLEK